jgi:hypothetical protein
MELQEQLIQVVEVEVLVKPLLMAVQEEKELLY